VKGRIQKALLKGGEGTTGDIDEGVEKRNWELPYLQSIQFMMGPTLLFIERYGPVKPIQCINAINSRCCMTSSQSQ